MQLTEYEQWLSDKAHEFIADMDSDALLDAIEDSMHPTMRMIIDILNSTSDELPLKVTKLYKSIHEDAMNLIKEECKKGPEE